MFFLTYCYYALFQDPRDSRVSEATIMPVGRFIQRLQETAGLKASEIANFAGVSTATVSSWERGRKSPHPSTQLLTS